jgi:hypothetical protein
MQTIQIKNFTLLSLECLSSLMNIIISTSLAPLLFTFPILFKPSYTFLQVFLAIVTY